MGNIIRMGFHERVFSYQREFRYIDDPHAGYSFRCDKRGNLLNPLPVAVDNYNKCVSGEYPVVDRGILEREDVVYTPPIMRCGCGEEIYLRNDVECECGQWYNAAGQQLSHPDTWGEETGEYFSDIMYERESDW